MLWNKNIFYLQPFEIYIVLEYVLGNVRNSVIAQISRLKINEIILWQNGSLTLQVKPHTRIIMKRIPRSNNRLTFIVSKSLLKSYKSCLFFLMVENPLAPSLEIYDAILFNDAFINCQDLTKSKLSMDKQMSFSALFGIQLILLFFRFPNPCRSGESRNRVDC